MMCGAENKQRFAFLCNDSSREAGREHREAPSSRHRQEISREVKSVGRCAEKDVSSQRASKL
jgi:hypothetical protein